MNYYITQEQYEQLREIWHHTEPLTVQEELNGLIEQIGNQRVTDLV
jgi:hypothetical protein